MKINKLALSIIMCLSLNVAYSYDTHTYDRDESLKQGTSSHDPKVTLKVLGNLKSGKPAMSGLSEEDKAVFHSSGSLVGIKGIGDSFDAGNFRGQNLSRSNLLYSSFKGADLENAKLVYTNLRGADLTNANLKDADLTGADLKGAELKGANLEGVNLTKVELTPEQLISSETKGAKLNPKQRDIIRKHHLDLSNASHVKDAGFLAKLARGIVGKQPKSNPKTQDFAS